MMMKEMKKQDMDLISKLPEHVIHHIQSILSAKDAARTCILSKTWKSVCTSYPVINFDQNFFGIWERFVEFVNDNLWRLVHRQESRRGLQVVRKLGFKVVIPDEDDDVSSKYFSAINHWMEMVRQVDYVEELSLTVASINNNWQKSEYWNEDLYYDLPCTLFAGIQGLKVVSIDGCKFSGLTSFVGSSFSLKQVYLSCVFFDNQDDQSVLFDNLMLCCPELQVLELKDLSSSLPHLTIKLPNFPKLRKFTITESWSELSFEIKATNLESFIFDSDPTLCKFLSPPSVFGSIRLLFLDCRCIYKRCLFGNLATSFPLLEEAYFLVHKTQGNDYDNDDGSIFNSIIAVNHHHLRILVVSGAYMEEIKLVCPNLRLFLCGGVGLNKLSMCCPSLIKFGYKGTTIPVLSSSQIFTSSLDHNNVVDLECHQLNPLLPSIFATLSGHDFPSSFNMVDFACVFDPKHDLDTSWFVNLRRFVQHVGRKVIPLSFLFCSSMATFNLKGLDVLPVSTERSVSLSVKLCQQNMRGQPFLVDGLIWSTLPTTLTIEGPKRSYKFVKHLCQKLHTKSSNPSICEEFCNKHWWHRIKDFEVESNMGVDDIKDNLLLFVEQYYRKTSDFYKKLTFKFYWF